MITALDKNTALVLIDLQKGVAKMSTAHPVPSILEKAAQLVEAFRKANLPVVIVNVIPFGASWLKSRKDSPSPLGNTPPPDFAEIVPEIKTQSGDIFITKKTWNAFFNTPLHEELQQRNITGIVLAGISTSIGVEGTARAASELGYNITFATDAMTDMKPDAHQNSLNTIFPRIGETGNTQDVIRVLQSK